MSRIINKVENNDVLKTKRGIPSWHQDPLQIKHLTRRFAKNKPTIYKRKYTMDRKKAGIFKAAMRLQLITLNAKPWESENPVLILRFFYLLVF